MLWRARFQTVVKIPPPGTGPAPPVDGPAELAPTRPAAESEAADSPEGVESALAVEASAETSSPDALLLEQLDGVFRDELERIFADDPISAGRLSLSDE